MADQIRLLILILCPCYKQIYPTPQTLNSSRLSRPNLEPTLIQSSGETLQSRMSDYNMIWEQMFMRDTLDTPGGTCHTSIVLKWPSLTFYRGVIQIHSEPPNNKDSLQASPAKRRRAQHMMHTRVIILIWYPVTASRTPSLFLYRLLVPVGSENKHQT